MAQARARTRTGAMPHRTNGSRYRPTPVPLYVVAEAVRREPRVPTWARVPRLAGRATVWAVPAYAVAVLVSVGQNGAPVTIAVALGPLALLSVAGLLAGRRSGWIALAGAVLGTVGELLVRFTVGTAVPGYPHPHPATVTGAVLLTAGWLLAGVAVAGARGYAGALRLGDALMLVLAAVPLCMGGFLLAAAPRLAAVLLLAAGIGLCGSALDPTRWPGRAAAAE